MLIRLNGKEKTYDNPVSVAQVVQDLLPDQQHLVLGCFCNGPVFELNHILREGCDMQAITYQDEEGRRIYERTLRFVMLLAVKRCFPGEQVRIEHSIGNGIYIILKNRRLYPHDVITIENTMRDIVQENMPLVKSRWSRDEAIDYFTKQGDLEKARLLSYRPYDYFNIYQCGGMAEYFYGAMLPTTGWVPVFALHPKTPGLVMLLPSKEDANKPATFISQPKQMATFAQSNYWCRVLDCTDAADLNDLIKQKKLRDFIRVNEALHDKSLSEIADDILVRGARAIFISGPSSSGKTTFANRLSIHLRVNGLRPVLISMDDFYRNRDELPLEEDGKPDLEAMDALDIPLLKQCLTKLMAGQNTQMPRFNFTTQRQTREAYTLRIDHQQPLIIEGIHGLNPSLHEGFDPKMLFRIYISELTCLNLDNHNRIRTTDARLLRRIVRDYQFRNTSPLETLALWDKVRRGEERWIFPYQENADMMFNSALHYELPILKKLSFDLLHTIPKDSMHYLKSNRIIKILNYLLEAPEDILDEIPPLSILREFIGGNTLYLSQGDH